MLREILVKFGPVAAGLRTRREQGAFGRVADDFPGAFFIDQMRVVAAELDMRQLEQGRRVPRVCLRTVEAHLPVRPVAFTADLEAPIVYIQRTHGHLPDRQRAGLVGADDRGRAQRFDRRQFTHQRAAARHAQYAEPERNRDDRGQSLRHGGHRQADRGHEQLEQRGAAQQAQAEQQRHDAQRAPRQEAPERVELLLQGRALGCPRSFNQSGDTAQFGIHPGGHHHRLAGSRRDAGAHEYHVRAVAERYVALLQRGHPLGHRRGLTGQSGLDALEGRRVQQPGVGRDQVAGFQHDDVTDDDVCSGNRSDLAVAPYLGLGRGHALERRDRFLGLELLDKADDRVEDDDGEDGEGIHQLTEQPGDGGRGNQNPDDQALELAQEELKWRDLPAFFQGVGAIGREPLFRFRGREPGSGGGHPCQNFRGRQGVPDLACRNWGDHRFCAHAAVLPWASRRGRRHFRQRKPPGPPKGRSRSAAIDDVFLTGHGESRTP